MKPNWVQTTVDEMNRARKALKASESLFDDELYEDAVSRAYYAVLHALCALRSALCVALLLAAAGSAWANNLVVTNVAVSPRDATTAFVAFDLSWENSWRETNSNHDAAWVFFKVRQQGATGWTNHVVLEGTGTNPRGYSVGTGTAIEMVVPTDKVGLFVRRAQPGAGSVSVAGVKAVWNIASSGMASTSIVEGTACAVEMVYVAEGSFDLGDGNGTSESARAFHVTDNTKVTIDTTLKSGVTVDSNTDEDIDTSPIGIDGDGGLDTDNNGTVDNPDFPTGYKAFYCMKYEITQGQYTDFLNLLTSGQDSNRYFAAGNRCTIGGTWPNHTVSAPDRACNWPSWADGCAFADWAGLRPMTELEYEKACRGTNAAVAGEYAWGNTSIAQLTAEAGDGTGTSTVSTVVGANCLYGAWTPSGGPCRVGIFATATSSRQQAGASYWGIMELSGNVWERTVTIGTADGRNFTGSHGNGKLNATGDADVSNWPGTSGQRGGGWSYKAANARASDRESAALARGRTEYLGWRGVRSAPLGLATGAVWTGEETNRWHGGSFDGWDRSVTPSAACLRAMTGTVLIVR